MTRAYPGAAVPNAYRNQQRGIFRHRSGRVRGKSVGPPLAEVGQRIVVASHHHVGSAAAGDDPDLIGVEPDGAGGYKILTEWSRQPNRSPTIARHVRCEPVGGELHTSDESTRVKWVTPSDAVASMPEACAVRVTDALCDGGPFVRIHDGTAII